MRIYDELWSCFKELFLPVAFSSSTSLKDRQIWSDAVSRLLTTKLGCKVMNDVGFGEGMKSLRVSSHFITMLQCLGEIRLLKVPTDTFSSHVFSLWSVPWNSKPRDLISPKLRLLHTNHNMVYDYTHNLLRRVFLYFSKLRPSEIREKTHRKVYYVAFRLPISSDET